MKFNSRENKEVSNFKSSKVIQAKIGNTAKMLKMFTKDLYKHPMQTAIQEYINNAKDAHVMAGKSLHTIEITAPTVANQNVIIKDFGPGLSPDDIVNIFANIAVSNKDNSDLFNGGFGIGSKSWFAVSSSFVVISVFNNTKSYYSVKFDEKKGIFIELDFEESVNEINGVEVQLPLANSNQISDASRAIFRAVEFWDERPTLINCEKEFVDYEETKEDFTLISYNNSGKNNRLEVTLGKTPYSIKELPCYYSVLNKLKFYNIAIHFKVGEMELKDVQEVGPDRESYALICSDKILSKVNAIHEVLKERIVEKLKNANEVEEINELISHPEIRQTVLKGFEKKVTDRVTIVFKSNQNTDIPLNKLPMKIKDMPLSYIAVDGRISAGSTYLERCDRASFVLILDKEKVPETAQRVCLNNFIEVYDDRPNSRGRLYNGIYVVEKETLSKEDVEALKKYYTVKTFSELEVIKPKVVKAKVERNKNEINLMKVNWLRNFNSNIKIELKDLKNDELQYLTKEDFDRLNISWDIICNHFVELGTKVFMISNGSSGMFETLKFKKFDIEKSKKLIEEKKLNFITNLKKEAIDSKFPERYAQRQIISFFVGKFSRYDETWKTLFSQIGHPFCKSVIDIYNPELLQELDMERRKYNSVLADIELPQEDALIKEFESLRNKYPMVMDQLMTIGRYSDSRFPEIKFLMENFVK